MSTLNATQLTTETYDAVEDPAARSLYPLPPRSVTLENLDRMPAEYRHNLVRLMAMQAYAERLGTIELGAWIGQAPNFADRRIIARIASDEANHAYWLYRELKRLGVSEAEAIAIAEGRTGSGPANASLAGPKAVGAPDNSWEDVPLNNMFLDRAGRFMVSNFAESSYEPWAKVAGRILVDEKMHEGFGLRELRRMVRAVRDRDALAARVTRWFALGLNFIGPPSSSKTELLRAYGLKRRSNEELRQAYREECVKLLANMGAGDLVRFSHDAYPYA